MSRDVGKERKYEDNKEHRNLQRSDQQGPRRRSDSDRSQEGKGHRARHLSIGSNKGQGCPRKHSGDPQSPEVIHKGEEHNDKSFNAVNLAQRDDTQKLEHAPPPKEHIWETRKTSQLHTQRIQTPPFNPNMNSSNQGIDQAIAPQRQQIPGPTYHNATLYYGTNDAQRRPSSTPIQERHPAPKQERKKKILQILDPATGKDLMEDIIHSSEHTTSGTSSVVSQTNDSSSRSNPSGPAETVLATSPPNVIAAEFAAKVAAKLFTSSTSSSTNTQTQQQRPPSNTSDAAQQQDITMEPGPPQIMMQHMMGNNIQDSNSANNILTDQSQPTMRPMMPTGGPPSGPQNPLRQSNAVNIPQINSKMHPDVIRGCSDISPFLDNTYLPNIVDTAIHDSADNSSANHSVVLQSQYDIYSNGKTSTIHVEAPEFVPQSMAAHVNPAVPVQVLQDTRDSGNASVNDKPQTANISNVSQTEHAPVVNKVGIPPHHSQGRGEPVTVSVPKTTERTSDDQENVSAETTVKHVVTRLVRVGTPEEHIMSPTPVEMEAKVQIEAKIKLQQHRLPTPQFNPNTNSSNQAMYQPIAPQRQQLPGPPYHNVTMYFGPNDQRRPSLKPSQGGPQAPNQERKKKKIQILDQATGKDLMEDIIYSSEQTTSWTLSVVSQAIDSSATSSQSGPAETVLATSPPNVIAAEFAAKVAAKLSTSSTSSSTNTQTQQQRPPSNTSGAAQQQDITMEPGPPQIMIQHMMGNNIRGSSPAHNIPADQSQPMMRHIMPPGGPPLGPQNPLQQSNPVNIQQINPNMHPDAIRGRSDISPFLDTTYLPNIVDTAIHGFADKSSANSSANLQSQSASLSNGKTSPIHVEAPVFVPQSMAVHVNPTVPVREPQDTSDSGNVSVNDKPQTTNISDVSHTQVGSKEGMPPHHSHETETTSDNQEHVSTEATVEPEVTRVVREGTPEVHSMPPTLVQKEAKVQLEAEPKLQHQRLPTPPLNANINSSNQAMYQPIAPQRQQLPGHPYHNVTMYFGPNDQRRPSSIPIQDRSQAPNQERKKKKLQILDPATGKDLMDDIIQISEHTTSGTSSVVSQAIDSSTTTSQSGPAETVLATSPPNVIAAEFAAKVAAKLFTSSTSSSTNTQTQQQRPPFKTSDAPQQQDITMEPGPPKKKINKGGETSYRIQTPPIIY